MARSAAQAGASFLVLQGAIVGRRPNLFWRPGAVDRCWPLRHGIKPTKEKSDDQMDSTAVDRQVRAHVEL
jgi:hypothetical protein